MDLSKTAMQQVNPILLELATRCEKATGPDRELNGNIWQVCMARKGAFAYADDWEPPAYTASLDDALTLVPEGWAFRIGNNYASIGPEHPLEGRLAEAATPALALCAAALRAQYQYRIEGE